MRQNAHKRLIARKVHALRIRRLLPVVEGEVMSVLNKLAQLLLLGCVIAAPAYADDGANSDLAGHFQVRLRGLGVLPDPKATILVGGANIGGKTNISDSAVPEVDGTYFITDHIGVEVIAATTKHTVSNTVAGRVSSVWLLPPTVTAQWHFDPTGPFRPYVGAGINYTFFYSPNSALNNIRFKDNIGWALQAGADVPWGDDGKFLNFDVKKLFLPTTITATGVSAHARLDPWIIGGGIGIRF
jgi:outer membrane protein